jgi:Ger(x)C family germination protein
MKKFKRSNRLGERILLLTLALFAFLFFSNDFGLIDIQKTAIVLAAGIDAGENGGYVVSAEIAAAEPSTGGRQVNEVTVSGEGETIAQAFRNINLKTGCFPKISFCDLIVLGEEVAKADVFNVLGFFLRNEYMSDNCLLAACEGKAADILSTTIPTDGMTAIGLGKILSTEAKEAGNISTVNLKDFAVGYYSEHKSSYMPYIRKVVQPEGEQGSTQGGTGSSERSGGSGGSGGNGGSGGSGGSEMFNAARTAVFYEGKMAGILTEEESFAFNLVSNHIRLATVEVPFEGQIYALGLKNIKGSLCFSLKNNVPTLEISLKANAQTTDTSRAESIEEVTQYLSVKEGVLRETEKILTDALLSAFESCRSVRCDLFEVVNKLKRCERRYYGSYKDIILERTTPAVTVTVTDLA